jgi:OOP family OmpA-OmpF porin
MIVNLRLKLTTAAVFAAVAMTVRASAAESVPGFALERFAPPPGDALWSVPAPWVGGHLVPRFGVTFDYAHQPFRIDVNGIVNVVSAQGVLRSSASLALWNRVLVAADVPVAIVQGGQQPPLDGTDFHPPSSPAMGDIRFDLRGRIFGEFHSPFQLGLTASMYVPTGSKNAYAGDGAPRVAFSAALGGRTGRTVGFLWGASGGVLFRAATSQTMITLGAGAAITFLDERIQVGPELLLVRRVAGDGLTITNVNPQSTDTSVELLFGAKARLWDGLFLGAAGGPSPVLDVGTPIARFVTMIGWAPLPAREERPAQRQKLTDDRDGDGIRDDVDACPDTKGELQSDPSKDGCPLADRDGDRVLDTDDACPGAAGIRSADPIKNGCPKDSDGDDIHDGVDACPNRKGIESTDPKRNGCPPDRDGDGVTDASDACPEVAGPSSVDLKWNGCPDDPDGDGIRGPDDACPREKGASDQEPRQNGCPKLVRVTQDEILLKTKIRFRIDGRRKSETIDRVSADLMTEIRDVIEQHPEIQKIEVQGHTDDAGTEAYNLKLSQDRADAVRQWLIDAGIPAEKLVAKGYGLWKPLADNRVNIGRTKNRRVQFIILERKAR